MGSLTIITVVVVVGLTEAKNLINKSGFSMKPVIAGFILGLILFAFDAIDIRVSRAMCMLVMTSALIYNGSKVADVLTVQSKSTTKKATPLTGGGGRGNSIS